MKKILLITILALSFAFGAELKKEKVILDTDMVEMFDDGVALIMLANAPNIDLLGVTTVTGNSWADEGVAYSIRHLEIENKGDIPVANGAQFPLRPDRHANFDLERASYGMGHDLWLGSLGIKKPKSWEDFYKKHYGRNPTLKPIDEHAVNFLINTIRANPNEITIAAIGPATNLALAIRIAPDIVPLIKRVVYMGGAFYQQENVTPAAEFNWWIDPEAAQITLRSPFKEQVIFGLDVCEKVEFRKKHYNEFVKTIAKSGELEIIKKSKIGRMFETKNAKDTSPYIWDVLVAAYIIDPSILTKSVDAYVDVNTQFGASYGQSIAYADKKAPQGTQKAKIVLEIDQKKLWKMVNDPKYWNIPK